MFSDVINTVSPTYAEEIQTEEYGEKLEGVLRMRSKDLYGILNGIDYELYNPATDRYIYVNYDVNRLELKWENKVKLQEELGLPLTGNGCSRVDKQTRPSKRSGPSG